MTNRLSNFIFILLFGLPFFAYAQHTQSVSGTVVDENNKRAPYITVVMVRLPDSVFVKATATGNEGVFSFNTITPGTYILYATGLGYQKVYTGPFQVQAGVAIPPINLALKPQATLLHDVVIQERRKYIDVRQDKTVINVDRGMLSDGASVSDILRMAPGIKAADGDISFRAGQKASVYINGKRVAMSDADLGAYLQSLSSANVEQIELIQNPSAKYDSFGTGGVINIILRKGKNEGFNGNLVTTAGLGKFGRAGQTVSSNYRTGSVNVFGTVGYNYRKVYHTINTDRNVVMGNDMTGISTHYYNTQRTPQLDYRLGADFFIDSLRTLGFLIYGNSSRSTFDKQTTTNILLNGLPDSTFNTPAIQKRNITFTNYNLNYGGRIGRTRQTISIDADYSVYDRSINENLITSASAAASSKIPVPDFLSDTLRNSAPTKYRNPAVKIDYSAPVGRNTKISAGFKYSYLKSENEQQFQQSVNGSFETYPAFTNDFTYKEKLIDEYLMLSGGGTKFTYNAGLRLENMRTDAEVVTLNHSVKRTYTNFFPSVQLNYALANEGSISLGYNRRMDPAPYDRLNPTIFYQDNYNYNAGNAYLSPAYENKVQLSYTAKSGSSVTLHGDIVTDPWHFSFFRQLADSKVLITTRTNFKSSHGAGLSFNVPVQAAKWWEINFSGDGSYISYTDNANYTKGAPDVSLDLTQNFTISNTIKATVNTSFETPSYLGISNFRSIYSANASISKQLLKNRATLTLAAYDIFNTYRYKTYTNYQNLDIHTYDKTDTRYVSLTFSYRFGKKTVKAARKHVGGNDEQQKRLSGG